MTFRNFRYFLTVIVLVTGVQALAQDYAETAMLLGRNKPAGSARILAMGGAQTALGGDYSAGQSNPAGLGMYNRSEFTFSLGYNNNNTQSAFNGNKSDASRNVINIPGLSYTHHLPQENGSFLGGALSFSLTRTNDFNSAVKYSGPNSNNSIIDYFIDQAYGNTTYQFENPQGNDYDPSLTTANHYNDPTGLAYYNYLIGPLSSLDPNNPDDIYFTDAGYPEIQREEIKTKGASNQWNISYGANFEDKFFLGAGVGISSLRYKTQKIFFEQFDNPDTIQNLILNEDLDIRGSGVNATLGAIVRPVDFLQIGISYRTPTLIGITENYKASMSTKWNNFDYYGDGSEILRDNTNDPIETDLVISEYDLVIPSKLSTGFALLSKFGLFTADVEFTNPGKTKYRSNLSGISFDNENASIKEIYDATVNYRFGAEYRLNMWRFRAGYCMMANTYKSEFNVDNKIQTISGGVGIRKQSYYVDFVMMHNHSRTLYQPYTFYDSSGPVVKQKNNQLNAMVTVGFTF